MQHKLRRFMSVLILAVTVLNGIALTSHKAYALDPNAVNNAVNSFALAISKFSSTSANVSAIVNFCNRLSGLSSAASGVIGILQMIGIIKDPTAVKLSQILNTVKDVQTELSNMNNTLKQITQDLLNIQTAQQEIARKNKAMTMSTNWNNFNTNYTEKLKSYVDQYQAYLNSGIKKWWEQASHEGVYVLMTKKYTEKDSLT